MPLTIPSLEIETGNRIPKWWPSVFRTGSSFISAVEWDISSKFGRQIDFHILNQIPSLNLIRKYISDSMAAILKNRYHVITPPPIVRLLRNLAGRCKITCRWLHIRRKTRNRIPIWRPTVFWNRKLFYLSRELKYLVEIWQTNRFPPS